MRESPPPTPLMAMLRGVVGEPIGHLVLADWLDEHLDRADLAGILRRTVPGPPPAFEGAIYIIFRYQPLDEATTLFLGRWLVADQTVGFLICLGTRKATAVPMIRWVRWLPEPHADDVNALWRHSREDRPNE